MLNKLAYLKIFLISWLSVLIVATPALASSPSGNASSSIHSFFEALTNTGSIIRGNLEIGYVTLDGIPLFPIAAPANFENADNPESLSPLEWRVNEIEQRLNDIVETGFEPSHLSVTVKTLNQEPVLLAAGNGWERTVMTVTEADLFADTTIPDRGMLAEQRAVTLQQALVNAQLERQPAYFLPRLGFAGLILGLTGMVSFCGWAAGRWLRDNSRMLQPTEAVQTLAASSKIPSEQPIQNTYIDESARVAPRPILANIAQWFLSRLNTLVTWPPLRSLLKTLLGWGQVVIWLVSVVVVLFLFPGTRVYSLWLMSIPVNFLSIALFVSVGKEVLDFLVHLALQRWAYQRSIATALQARRQLRLTTLDRVLDEVTLVAAVSLGLFWFLANINIPVLTILAGIGILSFAFQDVLKDLVGGMLILWEDQYVIGDVVEIDGLTGTVEYLSLRVTKLRHFSGKLMTIANSSFRKAVNLSYQWSGLDFTIRVAYRTDIDSAITVIEKVIQELYAEPQWQALLLSSPELLGVDDLNEDGITFKLLVKTLPKKHVLVARECRRRVKSALDQANIMMALPQRSIWVQNQPLAEDN